MLNKNILISLFFIASAVFAITYTVTSTYEPVTNLFTDMFLDSLDTLDNPPPPAIKDVSQMFNERGYFNSNGFSFDESEIINDFNGNLIYEIPLYNYKLAGEMQYEVKLIYNGSVGHQVNIGDKNSWIGPTQSSHNFNAPEWILSLNGIAVQVFNFEPNFFSKPTTTVPYQIKDYALNMLIPGYHFDDNMKTLDGTERDRINILAGDGSVITLVNKSWNSGEEERYIGAYHSEGKETHYKATVTYIDGQGTINPNYKNRIVELTKGDGLVYIFYEYKRSYQDLNPDEISGTGRRPQMLILQEIKDRFGYRIDLAYNHSSAPGTMGLTLYGRPLLVGINNNIGSLQNANIGIMYSPGAIKLFNNTDVNGNYTMRINQTSFISPAANNIGSVTEIFDPAFQRTIVDYEPENYCIRKLQNVANPLVSGQAIEVISNLQKRISKFTNLLGGIREYKYYPDTDIPANRTLSMFLNISSFNFDQEGFYKGYGREPFYTNMLLKKNEKDGIQTKSETTYNYEYSDASANMSSQPVDAQDDYETHKTVTSQDGSTLNNTANPQFVKRYYKVYPVRYNTQSQSEVLDFNGVTKLLTEEYIDASNSTVYLKNEFSYSVLPINNNIVYNGSFLMTNKKSYIEGKLREWSYQYSYAGNSNDSLINKSVETDPKGIKTSVDYDNFHRMMSINIASEGFQGATAGNMVYYRIGIPKLETKYDENSDPFNNPLLNMLFKKSYTYIEDDQSSLGYFGQLISEKTYNNFNFNSYIETKYEYYKLDNIGIDVYGAGRVPYKEGNLKQISKPDGQEERYFYHPISHSENALYSLPDQPQNPQISFKIKYNNGNVVTLLEHLWDHRLPTRIDNYRRTGPNTVDTLKKIYMQYNAAGMPIKIINENNYLTELIYQKVHRINSITLPGDFSTVASYDEPQYEHNVYYTSNIYVSNGWGGVDLKNGINKATFIPNPYYIANNCYWFSMEYQNTAPSREQAAFMKFDITDLNGFISIDSASTEMWPQCYLKRINGIAPQPNQYSTKLQPVDAMTGPEMTVQCPGNTTNWLERGVSLYNYTQTIDVITDDQGCQSSPCWFSPPHKFDITLMLQNMRSNSRNLTGLIVKPQFNFQFENGNTVDFKMRFIKPVCLVAGTWAQNYAPRITINGTYDDVDTLMIRIINGGTYVYQYDDENKTIMVNSRLTHSPNRFKRVKHYIDGFGNIKQKDIFKVDNVISPQVNTFKYKFNYFNKPARSFDANNDSTMFSYDFLERPVKTKNSDQSSSVSSYSFQNNLSGHFGGYTGFVERQTFTDEADNHFYKYFDAAGNILREVKFIADPQIEDINNPYDPDTTFAGQDNPGNVELITDYKYDKLNRLVEVKTPQGKTITYSYDAYSRQNLRVTPDAGNTKYTYDNNSNLVYSQDANQFARASNIYTFRNYDGLNRLTALGETQPGSPNPNFDDIDIENPPQFDSPAGDDMFIINVYDTITNAWFNGFSANTPAGYSDIPNLTKGTLAATAYRTKLIDTWSYKFYRYDERGNVIKLWHYIAGLGWKTEMYYYNSQNQLARNWYQQNQSDGKLFFNDYDDAGRLSKVKLYLGMQPEEPEEETDFPAIYLNLTSYTYNPNSQIENYGMNQDGLLYKYTYNNRGWVTRFNKQPAGNPVLFYDLGYNPNGNIRQAIYAGSYKENFGISTPNLSYKYVYDESNRLRLADEQALQGNTFTMLNNYDKDGNILILKRYGSSNNLVDNFSYSYYSGTNKLQSIFGSKAQYTYDANGNMTKDEVNKNYNILYDHRNLITDIRTIRQEMGLGGPEDKTYWTIYKYDEAGNRNRKITYKYNGSEPDPEFDENGDNPSWDLVTNEFYIRDVSGKEIALYSGSSLTQWNIWGLDNVGKINADTTKNYYLKDHLGSIRVVLNSTNTILSAQDYDAWGYPLENRSFQSTNSKYKFVSSELDNESNYIHFGVRQYDSRIGRFLAEEPIISGSFGWSSYIYAGDNPLIIIDPTGTKWFYNYSDEDYEWEDSEQRWQWTGKYDQNNKKIFEKVQGLEELLYFTGSYLQWLVNDGTRILWAAVSGVLKNGKTQSDKQHSKDYGPIPEGTYYIDPNETYSIYKDYENNKYFEVLKWWAEYSAWGYYKTPIHPTGDTDTGNRGGFYIHGGSIPGSIGCIDLTSLNDSFHENFLNYNRVMLLHVDYSKLK